MPDASSGSTPLRVSMISKHYPPHLGGIEFHMRDLAEGLVCRGDACVRAVVADECGDATPRGGGPSHDSDVENVGGVAVRRLPCVFERASTPVVPSMRAAIAAEAGSADVLHFHFPYPWAEFVSLPILARCDVPVVVTYHSDIVRQRRLLALYRPFLERFLDRADLLIATSPNMVEHSEFLASRADKCRVVNFGIPLDRFIDTKALDARGSELRASIGIANNRPLVLFVGRLVYYKGLDVLLRAMPDVDANLVVIGNGPLAEESRALCENLSIADRVTFLEPCSGDDLAAWYRTAGVLCLPSVERSEAFGLVQIEAHACGTPTVCTDLTTGVPYATLDERTGLVVPVGNVAALADALQRVLADDVLRGRLGVVARRRAFSEFTVDGMCKHTMDVYREAIALRDAVRGSRSERRGR